MNTSTLPETQYAQSGDFSIAYQVMGDGPVDIILVPGIISHIDFQHELPGYTRFLRRLAKFARVVTFDKRGQGLSDRLADVPSLEERIDDVRAIMDAIGSKRAVLVGFSEGAAMCVLFATTYPERVSQVVLFGGLARIADLMSANLAPEVVQERLAAVVNGWGNGQFLSRVFASDIGNPEAVARIAKFEKLGSSPGALKSYILSNRRIDINPILPSLRTPCLILHRATDAQVPVILGRKLAESIPGAKYIEYASGDHAFWTGDIETVTGDIEEFVTGHRAAADADFERILATVLFTDIVGSTNRAAQIGDQRWRDLLDNHDDLTNRLISKHRGTLVKSTGDGILATFDGPGRAVRCALALSEETKSIGLPVRAGLHCGEVEVRGSDIGGIAVHAAARVMSQSGSSEVLVSRVVTDLVAGTDLKFSERGSYELKGLPGKWDLFSASR
ncbi:adenylate/guanylate cyclase domain-containing protein [Bradyrhizobium sp. 197]|jgi:class 3 adenylate cyclase|uniref:adenylate/guanylate cyclase domain-containing protein n=1 Tax=Bradyrhizobium sp. 197 TaxID=2782663 RepID=UPI001FF75714|nr:adenylate/guanylate cyclase domain-containing protein [Bradyrhizobium sp. 197]MCK1480187.1 adenylate/guanylate cyclase domain-containing protein [Bradyrhizobium sp. 197]